MRPIQSKTLLAFASLQIGLFAVSAAAESEWINPTLPAAPSARCCAAMAYDAATHSTVLFGGGNGGIYPPVRNGDTWVFSAGIGWSQAHPSTSPAPRQGAEVAYDPQTGTVVLFGGSGDSSDFADTWTWDGTTWTEQFPPVSPSARDTFAFAYDPATSGVLLFGGAGANGVTADTWEWNGAAKTWTQLAPTSSPSPRRTTMVHDEVAGAVVLFGGDNAAGDCCDTYYNDTWEWNGTNWIQQFPDNSPSGRALPAMTYDKAIFQLVLFGGYIIPGNGLNDTWTWDGMTWTQRETPQKPAARWAAGIVFDPYIYGAIMFGGEITGDPFTNTTAFFVPRP